MATVELVMARGGFPRFAGSEAVALSGLQILESLCVLGFSAQALRFWGRFPGTSEVSGVRLLGIGQMLNQCSARTSIYEREVSGSQV